MKRDETLEESCWTRETMIHKELSKALYIANLVVKL